ncbi:hypothetical protein DICSQDRAFT_152498 [Dichomitus squalens LYAD-421 SS1]|uniref:uncharacterized protein n=1 Tax=Dichomitus squalens (strain LYAD-421) TaxID=732165 RepID=UPI0004410906|nr:uncharacterized protein DICSQDRAFT_152498 [Dichomitus squalens LYAD-421 SS1]EJF65250.1 hypothetical protein DICSQDRAFT_152498 [Dichomitus squalens LYAD-421 SS1]
MEQHSNLRDTASEEIPDIPSLVEFDSGTYFWESARPWLSRRGVELYEIRPDENPLHNWKNWWTPLVSTPAPLPFARCVFDTPSKQNIFSPALKLACGQDSLGRDVMLKLVEKDSPEYSIYQLLIQREDSFTDRSTFPCVLPPLAILDTPHQYSIVTMPTWGSPFHIEEFRTVREALRFMECILQGLVYLHANRIAHRDIFEFNIVVNCYRLDRDMERLSEDLVDHRRRADVLYALMDYDQSIYLPHVTSVKHCSRPAKEAWVGYGMYKPDDIYTGEPTYNPFAFDVGMLGNLFRTNFSKAVPFVTALPALFDKMTTHIVSQRFSAEEALAFFKASTKDLTQDALEASLELTMEYEPLYDSDVYWSRLPSELQARWICHRTPPLPRWFYVLNRLIQIPVCRRIILPVRRCLGI